MVVGWGEILALEVDGNGTPDDEIIGVFEPLFEVFLLSFLVFLSSVFEFKSIFANIPDSALTCPIILPTTL